MLDRAALMEKLLDHIQAMPAPPEYLGNAPDQPAAFDPYQLVSEWIALRHEVKQQNRLLQTAQTTLQKSLETEQAQNLQLQKHLEELATEQTKTQSELQQYRRDQHHLLKDLLKIMDALDQAAEYWRSQSQDSPPPAPTPPNFWRQWWVRLGHALFPSLKADPMTLNATAFQEVLLSNQQGIGVIQRSLLDLLRQKQVVPIESLGKPFDPQYMYAIGRQESSTMPENTVIQEVVRGYLWHDQVLREAQVMVAMKPR